MQGFFVDGIENFLNLWLYALFQCSFICIQLRFDSTLNSAAAVDLFLTLFFLIFRHFCIKIAVFSPDHRVINALQEALRVHAHSILSVSWTLLSDQFLGTSLHVAQQLSRSLELDDLLGVIRRDTLLYQLGQLLLLRIQKQPIKLVRRRVVG